MYWSVYWAKDGCYQSKFGSETFEIIYIFLILQRHECYTISVITLLQSNMLITGKFLQRLYKLKDKITIFLEEKTARKPKRIRT